MELVRTSGLEEKVTSSNLTLFVPSDDAVRDFTDSLQEAVSICKLNNNRHKWEDNIRMDLEEIVSVRVIGLIRLRIGIIGEPL